MDQGLKRSDFEKATYGRRVFSSPTKNTGRSTAFSAKVLKHAEVLLICSTALRGGDWVRDFVKDQRECFTT